MLKPIAVIQVKLGVYIHALEGPWLDNPFWKKSFLLDRPEDLETLQTCGFKNVIIDTEKGLDIDDLAIDDIEIDEEIVNSQNNSAFNEQVIASTPSASSKPPKVSIEQEQKQAKRILSASKKAVSNMFSDVRMGKIANTDAVMPLVEEISASLDRNENALVSLIRLKSQDDYTYMHSVAVCVLMVSLARELKFSEAEVRSAGMAGLMHDLGKAFIPLTILNKPGTLTDAEFEIVKQHPKQGYDLLLQAKVSDAIALDVCLHHHEKIDGTGYPEQLHTQDISIFAKMGAVCDVYDAVTSNRPYKDGWTPCVALQRMASWKNHFDSTVFKAFVKCVGIYPIGSMVLLKSGRLAVVIDQSGHSLLKPVVKVFFSTRSKLRIAVEVINLSGKHVNDEILRHEDPVLWGINDVHRLWAE
jgi:HD-GYP domain-containing protein (c-di-GMP phosphodiesterase class II)